MLGVFGTFTTAGLVALAGHYLFDFSWTTAGILGAALAPTDPAVMFSVLGKREVGGRTGTILEGESGVNDPVGIALMIGMIEFATHADATLLDRRPRVRARDVDRPGDRRRRRAGSLLRVDAPHPPRRTRRSTRCARSPPRA